MSNNNNFKKRKRFLPQNRGNVSSAAENNNLSQVAPSTPRPATFLEDVKLNSKNLIASDIALYELLIAHAYGDDETMEAKLFSINVSDVESFIEQTSLRASLRDSLTRLSTATADFKTGRYSFENAPLLVSWLQEDDENNADVIQYSFANPIRSLMSRMKKYAYIELLALSKMKSKYSSQLYKKFALEMAQKEWKSGESNEYIVSGTPAEIGQWAGLEIANFSMSKLKERVLSFLDEDFGTVRAFNVHMREHRKSGRGRTVERIDFVITLLPPAHYSKHVTFKKGVHKDIGIGAPDDPRFRVNSFIWEKVAKKFQPLKLRYSTEYAAVYFYAINEALTNDPISEIYRTAKYRGKRLMDAISELGADEAAWQFCHEEFENPDILPFLENNKEANEEADLARRSRLNLLKNPYSAPVISVSQLDEPIVHETVFVVKEPVLTPQTEETCEQETEESCDHESSEYEYETYADMDAYQAAEDAAVNGYFDDEEDDFSEIEEPVFVEPKLKITDEDSFVDASLKELINYEIPEKKVPQQVISEPEIEEEIKPNFEVSEPVLAGLRSMLKDEN